MKKQQFLPSFLLFFQEKNNLKPFIDTLLLFLPGKKWVLLFILDVPFEEYIAPSIFFVVRIPIKWAGCLS